MLGTYKNGLRQTQGGSAGAYVFQWRVDHEHGPNFGPLIGTECRSTVPIRVESPGNSGNFVRALGLLPYQ